VRPEFSYAERRRDKRAFIRKLIGLYATTNTPEKDIPS
jgi:hypothetical protein